MFRMTSTATAPKRQDEAGHQGGPLPLNNNKNGSKLQAVFSKLSAGVLPPGSRAPQDLGPHKTMSSDIIESVLADSPVPAPPNCTPDLIHHTPSPSPATSTSLEDHHHHISSSNRSTPTSTDPSSTASLICLTIPSLAHRLEHELRSCKRTHLSCGEVLLPCGLLYRISRDVLSMAESEPCGIKGCVIYVNFEDRDFDVCRKLSVIKCDPLTPTTFELSLTLKQSPAGWNFIPQFIKNFTRGGTIVLSPAYVLSKKKLYRSTLD